MITPGSNKEKGLEFELDAVFFEVIFGVEFNPVSPPSLTHCLSFTFSSYIFVAIRGDGKIPVLRFSNSKETYRTC